MVIVVASAAGLVLRQRQGKFRHSGQASPAAPAADVLSPADLGAPLGTQATLVQFSTEVCAYCGPTRKLLSEVAGATDGVSFVEIDAADRMDLTRRLHVLATPTVLVLDALGAITSRASGPLRRADLLSALNAVVDAGGAR